MTVAAPVRLDRHIGSSGTGKWTEEVRRGIPPLEAGDPLSRAEFERRYAAMPHVKKAELIEGNSP